MLQKLITNRYSPKESSNANSHYTNHQLPAAEKQEHYKSSLIGEKQKGNLYLSEEKITSMETILLEKDLQINSLL